MKHTLAAFPALLTLALFAVEEERTESTTGDITVNSIAAQAYRAAAAKSARVDADWAAAIREAAEKAARTAAANYVKEAVASAAKEASATAAKSAAAKTAEALAEAQSARQAAREERQRIDSRILKINHVSAVEVALKLNEMWSGEFGVNWKLSKIAVAFPESNAILLTAPRPILDACEKAVQALDVESPQVYIEARFVELGNTASHKVGIDWSMLDGMTGSLTLGGGLQSTKVGDGVREYQRTLTGKNETTSYGISGQTTSTTKNSAGDMVTTVASQTSDGDVKYFNGTLNFSQMALTLRALDATGDSKTFSNPKIIVSSGKKAMVDMTTKYPNVKVSAKRTDASGSTSLDIASEMVSVPGEDKFMFAKEAFFSWGISLEVTPRIGTNGLINVSIVPTISSLDSWVETGTSSEDSEDTGTISSKYPVIKVQRLISEFNLLSGTTAVIGGLSVTEERQVDNGIPVLREIPWIGQYLFGSKVREKVQKEIIVFVTVGLVDPCDMSTDAGLPKNAILGRQYTLGQKLEPGDRPAKNMEGYDSLDMRPLADQAKDPLNRQEPRSKFSDFIPFTKEEPQKEVQSK